MTLDSPPPSRGDINTSRCVTSTSKIFNPESDADVQETMDAESVTEDHRSVQRHAALAWSEEEIENTWKHTPKFKPNGFSVTGFPYPPDAPLAYIKFGDPVEWKLAEVRNQIFVHDALQQLPPEEKQGIHVPEVYRTMRIGYLLFIIMEFVPGRTLAQITEDWENWVMAREEVTNKIAQGMRLLLSLPVPCDAKPGPVGGGIIRHPMFKDCEAATEYDSVDMLERHLNKVAALRVKDGDPPTVTLERELHFYFGDLYHENFIFKDSGDLYFIDFEQAGFLPLSFMAYALVARWPIGFWIKESLCLPEDNIKAMHRAAYWFLIGVHDIGLPLDESDGAIARRGRRSRANDP
ncbi:hypothetical protein INS49_004607 [Diaporthe citri]|uniref:uncharacterized protein n=1 Tax=Diaporthe citri TaxID=83186 RepID=UPI001C7EE58A|nr:uncharacterized protein INS49_004607 [Diaporthe citri]KAG6354589.1 hypothetical protein INS49_004607 [Diaporthe citri]